MRTIIDVPNEVIESLDRVCVSEKCSRASLIRTAIAGYLKIKSVSTVEAAFGIWKNKGIDGVQYQEQVRSEWDAR